MTRAAALRWLACGGIWGLGAVLLLSPGSPEPPSGWQLPDKLAHLLAWLGMTGSLYLALAPPTTRWSWPRRAGLAFALGLGWGVATELLQAHIPLRSAEAADVLADAAGGLIGVGLARLVEGWWSGRASRRLDRSE